MFLLIPTVSAVQVENVYFQSSGYPNTYIFIPSGNFSEIEVTSGYLILNQSFYFNASQNLTLSNVSYSNDVFSFIGNMSSGRFNITAIMGSGTTSYDFIYDGIVNTSQVSNASGWVNFNWTDWTTTQHNFRISQTPPTFMPPSPINLQNTTGNFWVNHTWEPGIGNITNSYNMSQNGTWYNSTTNLYFNASVDASGWSNISVYAYNSSGTGTLNQTPVSQNTQAPSAPVYTISGYITDKYGLALKSRVRDSQNINMTFTDDYGFYNLNYSSGNYTIVAERSQYMANSSNVILDSNKTLNLTLTAESENIRIASDFIQVLMLLSIAIVVVILSRRRR